MGFLDKLKELISQEETPPVPPATPASGTARGTRYPPVATPTASAPTPGGTASGTCGDARGTTCRSAAARRHRSGDHHPARWRR